MQDFINIFMHCVLTDIKHLTGINNSVSDVCASWNLLRNELMTAVQTGKLEKSVHILEASRTLQSWMKTLQLQMRLYITDLDNILNILLQILNSGQCQQRKIIFESFTHIMAHDESNKDLTQKLLMLPFTRNIDIPMEVNNHTREAAQSLDVITMLKCLEVLCEFGNGIERLKVLNACISNCGTELAVGAVM